MSGPLDNIGFYTLTDARAKQASAFSPLWRCELILTDRCNFKCPYCRGIKDEFAGRLSYKEAVRILDAWIDEGLKNVRFSGGEPLLYEGLSDLVYRCAKVGVERIAVSSNGSLPFHRYKELVDLGVNDFSISIDACCASTGDSMSGGVKGAWRKVVDNVRELAKLTYVTAGCVITEENASTVHELVEFVHNLGVADIRIIPAAQYHNMVTGLVRIPAEVLYAHPILAYRVSGMQLGRPVRGLCSKDNNRCPLVLDDMAVVGGKHFPCIIYLREQGEPIGDVGPTMRGDRAKWAAEHDTHADPICSKNCLDFCADYNNRWALFNGCH